jgi:DNA-binding NarL/FixJ family response regulator
VETVVVDPVAAACQDALDAVVRGQARTAICSDDPEALPGALDAAVRNTVALPCRVVEEANRAPRLPDRLATTLHLVLAGCSNPSIARQLHQSESTVKRDINTLLRRFSAPNRLALVGVARSAGYGTRTG